MSVALKRGLFFVVTGLLLVAGFQNCGGDMKSTLQEKSELASAAATGDNTEELGNTPATDKSAGPGTPGPLPAPTCTINGAKVKVGEKVKAYKTSSVPYGQSCVSEMRECLLTGETSGTYEFPTCTAGVPADCLFQKVPIKHGQSTIAYNTSSVPYGQSCTSVMRTCTNGVLSGSGAYNECTVGAPAACLFNGVQVAHGASADAYPLAHVPYGQTCTIQKRACNNGVLGGTAAFSDCAQETAPVRLAPCSFNGKSIAHGQSVDAFKADSTWATPRNSTYVIQPICRSEKRTCNNGTLSGSATHASCDSIIAHPAELAYCTSRGGYFKKFDHTFSGLACGGKQIFGLWKCSYGTGVNRTSGYGTAMTAFWPINAATGQPTFTMYGCSHMSSPDVGLRSNTAACCAP